MAGTGISGVAVATITAGGFLVYTGITNVTLVDGLRSIMRGKAIAPGTQTSTDLSAPGLGSAVGIAANPFPDLSSPSSAGMPAPKSDIQKYAQTLLAQYGWTGQWSQFNALVMSESGWNPNARNPTSGAYGIPQALPASKLGPNASDYHVQLQWMMDYIKQRYGSPAAAWSFHQTHNWY
jgi:hypothetical protein